MDRHIKLLTELLEHHWDKNLIDCFGWGSWIQLSELNYQLVIDTFIYSHLNNENSIASYS